MDAKPTQPPTRAHSVTVVGGGPAGLMAAEVLAAAGWQVDVFDAMPSVGRKFLLAGKGGLNLTHAEDLSRFLARYGERRPQLEPMLNGFGPAELRGWSQGLGVDTFVGSSGRVFPQDLKAAPLLRAWLHRLRQQGVRFRMRHRWTGWSHSGDGEEAAPASTRLSFDTLAGETVVEADAVVLALGGASWPQLGSTGAWVPWLTACGVDVAPLRPSNCGFDVARIDVDGGLLPGWSEHLSGRFAGAPLKNVALHCVDVHGAIRHQVGECVVTQAGMEGSLVYAVSAVARDVIAAQGRALVHLDLLPSRSAEWVRAEVVRPRGSRSLATHLKARLGVDGVKAALLHELLPRDALANADRLSKAIKALPLNWVAPRPIAEAISSAGGVRFEALDDGLMLRQRPGVFCAGEMLDWEAPTGGYLLTACFASGRRAAQGAIDWIDAERSDRGTSYR